MLACMALPPPLPPTPPVISLGYCCYYSWLRCFSLSTQVATSTNTRSFESSLHLEYDSKSLQKEPQRFLRESNVIFSCLNIRMRTLRSSRNVGVHLPSVATSYLGAILKHTAAKLQKTRRLSSVCTFLCHRRILNTRKVNTKYKLSSSSKRRTPRMHKTWLMGVVSIIKKSSS